jgi:uncharacterized membrane protein
MIFRLLVSVFSSEYNWGMWKRIILVMFFFFLTCSRIEAQSLEKISAFDADIQINQDTSITVTEKITFFTQVARHGIERYIPYTYKTEDESYKLKFFDFSAKDEEGNDVLVEKSRQSGNHYLKIGFKDRTFTGSQTFTIKYTVEEVIKRFNDHDELYWDIVGESWDFPVENVTAAVTSNFAQIDDSECYSGKYGFDDGLCHMVVTDTGKVSASYAKAVDPGENVTIVVGLDQKNSQLHFLTEKERLIKNLIRYSPSLLMLVPISLAFLLWLNKGRDQVFYSQNVFNLEKSQPTKLKPVGFFERTPMVYQPLKDLTPGEAGLMIDEQVDNRDVIAEIIDLARKKYLKIEEKKKKKFLGSESDYVFTKLRSNYESLPEHQKFLMEKLFKSKEEVKLSNLKGSFYTHMNKVKSMIVSDLTKKAYFTGHPVNTRALYMILFLAVLSGAVFLVMVVFQIESLLVVAAAALQAPLLIWLAKNMVQKSAIGSNLYMQAKGLRQTINVGKWREQIKEKNLFIEEVLPFAISLGVVDKLASDMDKLNIKPPEYLKTSNLNTLNTASFINSFSQSASKSLSYNPSSHSSSSGSGFSGGFSGGGGGGGGGGSW